MGTIWKLPLWAALVAPSTTLAALPDVTLPSTPWKLTFATDGVTLRSKEYKPGSGGGSFLFSRKDGVSINVFIEPVKDCKAAVECRDKLWKLLQAKLDGTEQTAQGQLGDAATIEIYQPKQRNLPIHEKTLYAEFVQDGFWIDVRVNKGGFKPDDQAKLEGIVQSVRFEPKP
jgi:hypothetical protein